MTTSDNDSSRAGSWERTRERLDRFAGGVERGIFADVRAALDRVRELEAGFNASTKSGNVLVHRDMWKQLHQDREEALARAERAESRVEELEAQRDEAISRAERAEARRMAAEGAKREWDRMKAEVTRFREALEAIDDELRRTEQHRAARRTGGAAPATDTSMFAGAGPATLSKLGRHVRAALQGEKGGASGA